MRAKCIDGRIDLFRSRNITLNWASTVRASRDCSAFDFFFWRASPSSKIVFRPVDADSSAGGLEILEQFKAKIPVVNLENGLQHTCSLFAHFCSTPF